MLAASSANTIGLSVAALASISKRASRVGEGVARRAVDLRRAAHRVGVLHAAAVLVRRVDRAACQQREQVGGRAPLAARCGRAACIRGSNGWSTRAGRRSISAAAMSAARASRSAPSSASAATAVDGCVPLISASPSLASERRPARARPAAARAAPSSTAGRRRPCLPSPISTSARCASGARSPLAPTDPRLGTTGCTPRVEQRDQQLRASRRGCPSSPFASTLARSAIVARTAAHRQRRRRRRRHDCAAGCACSALSASCANPHLGKRSEAGVDAVDGGVAAARRRPRRRGARVRAAATATCACPRSRELVERERARRAQ